MCVSSRSGSPASDGKTALGYFVTVTVLGRRIPVGGRGPGRNAGARHRFAAAFVHRFGLSSELPFQLPFQLPVVRISRSHSRRRRYRLERAGDDGRRRRRRRPVGAPAIPRSSCFADKPHYVSSAWPV